MRTEGIIGIAFLSLVIGSISGYGMLPPEVITETEYVPEYIYITETEYVPEYIYITETEYVYVTQPLEQFDTVYELQEWLYNNDISERQYIPDTYDCDNFAVDLVREARADGYEIFICATDDHMFNMCEIRGLWYIIEPQTDEIWYWGPEL